MRSIVERPELKDNPVARLSELRKAILDGGEMGNQDRADLIYGYSATLEKINERLSQSISRTAISQSSPDALRRQVETLKGMIIPREEMDSIIDSLGFSQDGSSLLRGLLDKRMSEHEHLVSEAEGLLGSAQ